METFGGNAKEQLRNMVDRIEALESDKKGISDDIKDLYAEAKAAGFDCKAIRAVVKRRKQDKAAVEELEAVIELYLQALGDLATTPLGAAALKREGLQPSA